LRFKFLNEVEGERETVTEGRPTITVIVNKTNSTINIQGTRLLAFSSAQRTWDI